MEVGHSKFAAIAQLSRDSNCDARLRGLLEFSSRTSAFNIDPSRQSAKTMRTSRHGDHLNDPTRQPIGLARLGRRKGRPRRVPMSCASYDPSCEATHCEGFTSGFPFWGSKGLIGFAGFLGVYRAYTFDFDLGLRIGPYMVNRCSIRNIPS